MKLTLARPDHAEHVARFYRSTHGDEFPHPELFSKDTVAQLLRDEEIALVVATDRRSVVGSAVAFPQSYNQVIEIDAISVGEVPDRVEVAKALFEALRRFGLRQYGIAYFRARSQAAFKRGRSIGAVCWGYRPAPLARSLEDCELIMGFYDEQTALPRVTPPENSITRLPFAKRIIDSLGSEQVDLPYPKQFPVGAPRGTGTPVISGRVWPTYQSAGNYMRIESSAGPFPIEIIREFVGKVRQKGVTDIRMVLPVNHDEAFDEFLDFGFRAVAYLPGWYVRGTHRFDCIEMVAGAPRIPRAPETFAERAIAKIHEGLSP